MKVFAAVLIVFVLVSGCQSKPPPHDGDDGRRVTGETESSMNELMVSDIMAESRRNAIIAERVVHPYHFEAGGGRLNELGETQVESLAAYFRNGPGTLSVMRGDSADELYDSRKQSVLSLLEDSGVDVSRVTLVDTPTRVQTMSSDRAVDILYPDDQDSGESSNMPRETNVSREEP